MYRLFGAIFIGILILLQNKLWMNEIHTQYKLWTKMNEATVDNFPNFLLNKDI